MGFKDAKRQVIAALLAGAYQHEARDDIDVKNLLATNAVAAEDIIAVLKQSRGQDHESSAHHQVPSIEVHVVRSAGWYIKFYFLEPDTWFISVHP